MKRRCVRTYLVHCHFLRIPSDYRLIPKHGTVICETERSMCALCDDVYKPPKMTHLNPTYRIFVRIVQDPFLGWDRRTFAFFIVIDRHSNKGKVLTMAFKRHRSATRQEPMTSGKKSRGMGSNFWDEFFVLVVWSEEKRKKERLRYVVSRDSWLFAPARKVDADMIYTIIRNLKFSTGQIIRHHYE